MTKQREILIDLVDRYPVLKACEESIWEAFMVIKESFATGKKLLVAGNGGSAADSEHIVGELMKGFVKKRTLDNSMKEKLLAIDAKRAESLTRNLQQALPAIALTGHTALSTAYLNDVDGTLGFAQQVFGYGQEGDVFFGITTSGNSENVVSAVVVAKAKGLTTIALTGRDGGKIKDMVDVAIVVPEPETYKIQELHLPIYHALCLMLEDYFFEC
ncbi:MAG: SIS domain-containing protein [Lachnospiraceae bacterium]|nr:SIS domain-containing protein [Lachnospiraceae bacterium]